MCMMCTASRLLKINVFGTTQSAAWNTVNATECVQMPLECEKGAKKKKKNHCALRECVNACKKQLGIPSMYSTKWFRIARLSVLRSHQVGNFVEVFVSNMGMVCRGQAPLSHIFLDRQLSIASILFSFPPTSVVFYTLNEEHM